MIYLDSTTVLEVIPAAGKTTNESTFVGAYAEVVAATGKHSTAAVVKGATSTTAAVTVVAAPASGSVRSLKSFSIANADTVAATFAVRLNVSSTYYTVHKATVQPSETLSYEDGSGWRVTDAAGSVRTTTLAPQPPTGTIHAYGGSTLPTGYLLCDGSAVSRTTYADLFAAIGTNWGAGDSATTFNVPDLRGRSPIGAGTGTATGATAWSLGVRPTSGAGGEQAHTLSAAESGVAAHTHGITGGMTYLWAQGGTAQLASGSSGWYINAQSVNDAAAAAAANAHNTVHPVGVVNFMIKT